MCQSPVRGYLRPTTETVENSPGRVSVAGLGIIEQPAAGSKRFAKGQRVVGLSFGGPGAWQQYVAAPESQLVAVPASVSDEVAAQFYVSSLRHDVDMHQVAAVLQAC